DRRHVEVVDLLLERPASLLHRGSNRLEVPVLAGPDSKTSARVLLGEACASEQDRQKGEPYGLALPCCQGACRRPHTALSLACGGEFREMVTDVVRDVDELAGSIAARQLNVQPELL